MLKRLSFLIAASLLSTSAMANDWTGWYVGGNVGHSKGTSEVDTTLDGSWNTEAAALRSHVTGIMSPDLDPNGTDFGVQIGYNHVFSNGFLLGAEFGYERMGLDDSRNAGPLPYPAAPTLTYTVDNEIDVDDEMSMRVKLGYAGHRNMVYGTVGIARIDADFTAGITSNGNYRKRGTAADNLHGIQYGVGYEFDLGNKWSLRAELLRTDLEDTDYDTAYQTGSTFVPPTFNYTESVNQDLDYTSLRLGVNYRF